MSLADAFAAMPAWDDDERADRLAAVRRDLARRARRVATVPVKICPRCEEDLPATAYAVDESRPDGLRSRCRSCVVELDRERYLRRLGC